MKKHLCLAVSVIGMAAALSPVGFLFAYQGSGGSNNVTAHTHASVSQGGSTLFPNQITVSTLTVRGGAFSVTPSSFTVALGQTAMGGTAVSGARQTVYDMPSFGAAVIVSSGLAGSGNICTSITGEGASPTTLCSQTDSTGGIFNLSVGANTPLTVDASGAVGLVGAINGNYGVTIGVGAGLPVLSQTRHDFSAGINVSGAPSIFTSSIASLGNADGTNASAGYVGEFLSQAGSASTIKASGAYLALSTLTLTAGDYDLYGTCPLTVGGTTAMTALLCGISTSNTALDITNANAVTAASGAPSVSTSLYVGTGPRRISISGTTTYYLVGAITYSVLGGASWAATDVGFTARRIR